MRSFFVLLAVLDRRVSRWHQVNPTGMEAYFDHQGSHTACLTCSYNLGEGAPLVSFWIFTIYPRVIWAAVFAWCYAHRHAHHLHLPADLYQFPHPAYRRPGKLMGPLKNLHVPGA